MKKIISLILSFAMIAGIGMAAVSAEGAQIGFSGNYDAGFLQGETITAEITGLPVTAAELKGKVDSSEATVSVKAVAGAAYIESYTCLYDTENDVVSVQVQTKNAYQPIVSEMITVEFSLKLDGETYAATFDSVIGWDEFSAGQIQSAIDGGTILSVPAGPVKNTETNSNPVVITKNTNEAVSAAGDYEGKTLKLGFGNIAQADVKFSKTQTSANFYWDENENESVISSNEGAVLGFFNVRGENSFTENAKVTIFADTSTFGENPYLYSIGADGKLTAVQTEIDKGAIKFETKSLGCYVISATQLKSAGGTSSDVGEVVGENPFTGDRSMTLLVTAAVLVLASLIVVLIVIFRKKK